MSFRTNTIREFSQAEQERLAFVALGSNLDSAFGSSQLNVLLASQRVAALSGKPSVLSSLWQTEPVDCPPGSAPFINAIVAFLPPVTMSPLDLLSALQAIELEFGRHRGPLQNAPRPLDLDIIAFGSVVMESTELTLPHPRAHVRQFVLLPLAEIAEDYILPGQTISAASLAQNLPEQGKCITL